MNINRYEQRKNLFAQNESDAFGTLERITMISRDRRFDSRRNNGSSFGSSRAPRGVYRQRHYRHTEHPRCSPHLSEREGRITSFDSSVNSNVTSSLFSRQEILAQSQELSSSMFQEDHLRFGTEINDGTRRIDPELSALLDEVMSNVTGLSSSTKERKI